MALIPVRVYLILSDADSGLQSDIDAGSEAPLQQFAIQILIQSRVPIQDSELVLNEESDLDLGGFRFRFT